ncbi:MAG: hypothetical protein IJN79_01855 [Clostridia bacterium]|nr:hypothetical protein [Clostridia bacterium]MBQ7051530.1 hypothetical protein [Clostridia bacterium]
MPQTLSPRDAVQFLADQAEILLRGQERLAIAIDGMAASGKTTLSSALCARIPDSFCVHMDDFTLPFEQRFPGYFDVLLANADTRRMDREVLTPFLSGEQAAFRPYVCHPEAGFLPPVHVPSDTRVLIVEGAYCLHASLFDRYALRALMTIEPDMQRERIRRRNGEERLARFLSDWIPMENRHIAAGRLQSRCSLIIRA